MASLLVPIVANGLRAYSTVLLAHFSSNTIAAGVDHVLYGWLFFGLVMFLLFWLGFRWRERTEPESDRWVKPSRLSAIPPATIEKNESSSPYTIKPMILSATSGVVLLTLAPLSAQALSNRVASIALLDPTAPSVTLPWEALPTDSRNWKPHFAGAESELMQTYRSGQHQVHLYLAYYTGQQQGAELISTMNKLVDGERWVLREEGNRQVLIDGQSLQVKESIIRSSNGTRLVWSWCWVGSRVTSNPYVAKLLQAKVRLLNESHDSAILALGTDYQFTREDTIKTLDDFLQHTSLLKALNSFSNR